jgi:hypothetical protein
MSKGKYRFKETDVRRALQAAAKAGAPAQGIEFGKDGSFRLILAGADKSPAAETNEWLDH